MKKKVTYAIVALIVVVFAFGSIYMGPSGDKDTYEGAGTTIELMDQAPPVIERTEGLTHWADILIISLYAVMIVSLGLFVSRTKKGHERNEEDYFLAGKSLPWWAIGSSLIAANISAEQFVAMSGYGFAMTLAVASYEFMAALTLILVGKYFLPIFIEKKIYTIPQFIEKRYNTTLKTILAIFWLALFLFVNLTSVLYLGSMAMSNIIGVMSNGHMFPIWGGILILAFFAAAYSLWGGLSAVAWTDVIQVIILVIGGIITSIIALKYVGASGDDLAQFAADPQGAYPTGSVVDGLSTMASEAGAKMKMIVPTNHHFFGDLAGIGILIGGLWVANIYYWGFNQYIIQRTFAAKSLKESQRGIAFAAALKLIIPIIVVVPGIAAFVMFSQGRFEMQRSFETDEAQMHILLSDDNLYGDLPYSLRSVKLEEMVEGIDTDKAIEDRILAGEINIPIEIWNLTKQPKLYRKDLEKIAQYYLIHDDRGTDDLSDDRYITGTFADDSGFNKETKEKDNYAVLSTLVKADSAYSMLFKILPPGVKGMAFAAIVAAIISSLASMLNSIATIFTMDIYKPYFDKKASAKKLVNVGRISAFSALIIAGIIAPVLLGKSKLIFGYIQEYTGLVSPGILAIFLMGLFWKKATTRSAIIGALTSVPFALALKIMVKNELFTFPFLHQMGTTLLFTLLVMVVVSLVEHKGFKKNDSKGIVLTAKLFKTDSVFNIIAFAIMIILAVIYSIFWSGM